MSVTDKDKCLFQFPSSQSCRTIKNIKFAVIHGTETSVPEFWWSSEWGQYIGENDQVNYWQDKILELLVEFPFRNTKSIKVTQEHLKIEFPNCYDYYSALKLYPPGSQIIIRGGTLINTEPSLPRGHQTSTFDGLDPDPYACLFFITEAYYIDNDLDDGNFTMSLPIEQFQPVFCSEYGDYGANPMPENYCDFCGTTEAVYYHTGTGPNYPNGITFEYNPNFESIDNFWELLNSRYLIWKRYREEVRDVIAGCDNPLGTEPGNEEICECTDIYLTDFPFRVAGEEGENLRETCLNFLEAQIRICRYSEPLRMT